MQNILNSVHAQFHQLCTLDDNIKNKMWLYHYSLNGKTYEELESEVLKNGFAGLIKKDKNLTFKNLREKLEKLEEIANSEATVSELAKKLLQKDVTSHNVIKIQKLLEDYDRNR